MTGFARTEVLINGEKTTIELSSVNHRFLELSFRLPGQWAALEVNLRERVRQHISRGKLYISIRPGRSLASMAPLHVDTDRAQQYIDAANQLMRQMHSTDALSLDTLISLEGVMVSEEDSADLELLEKQLGQGLEEALTQLTAMRAREGALLVEALTTHLNDLEEILQRIEERAPQLIITYEEKMRQRIAEINMEVGVKEERLAMEVALMADRMDVTEELVRFRAHILHGRELLKNEGPIGRDLNFLVQELQREANTLGSKLRDVEVSRDVIEIKTEIEKLREQLQNLE
jgi:uncharacterized protein (TIGR00255 family)